MHKDQRNKLHKPQDPRTHGYSDSGVGLTERDRVDPFNGDESQRRSDYSEAVGGGLYTREKNPLDSHDSTAAQPAISHDATHESLKGAAYAPQTQRTSTAADDNVESGAQPRAPGSNTPPYWGSLPKAAGGGIYNTVTGHGSPGDDHDQHHRLPARPTEPETSHVAGNAADYPQTGVHNSVIGHGSQDEESMRHAEHPSGRAFAAPLPGVPEHQSTSPKNDVLVNDSGADISSPKASSPPQVGTLTSGAALSGAPVTNDSTAPRAFPLTDKENTDKTLTSERSDSHTKEALLVAGAAGAGTGVAASELADKHKHRHRNDEDSTTANRGVSQDAAASKDKHSPPGAIAGVLPHRQKQEKEPKESSPVKKKKSREDSPPQAQGEKRHHKILGIFHRHKDDKDSDETLAPEPQNDAVEPRSRHEKEKIAAGAAAGATGASVLRKHNKDDKESNKSPQSGSSPRGNDMHVRHTGSLPSPDTYSTGSPAHAPAATRQTENSQESQDNESSRAKPLLAAGAGAAAAGAYMHSRREGSPKAKGEHEQQSSTPFRSTGQSQSGTASNESGSYNTLATGTPSGVKTDSSNTAALETRDGATNEPGNYKVLASGTSSGVKTDSSALGSAAYKDRATSDSGPVQDKTGRSTGPYNVLPSGTPSGVKVQPSQRRRSEDTYAQRQGESNTQATGTKSGTDHGFGHIAAIPYTSPRTESTPEEPLLDTSHMGPRNDAVIHSREQSSSQMSPEVMPAAYTATAPRSTPAPGTSQDTTAPVTRSPPTSEKDSAPPVPPKHKAQGFSERHQTARSSGQGTAPALAAATGAWATSAGASSGAAPHDTASSGGAPKVVHKCHNCGVDNDISSYFNKDAQPKPSGTGFW
ncbi:hypothetical protein B0T24DRAFT_551293 [Lasiosphaeria ovina]|uniref:Uncharacterized protein n=1 Tax=Lasiosphaeria ovina TaxID=92902 RepID=A0AAE0KJ64_9PEZI|nr:hypothetical protein B0T24DRAFT_551293 [Lasiosphaeria ovina]